MWAADTASRRLGIELEEVGDDRARVRMVVADWMSNYEERLQTAARIRDALD